MSGSVFVSYSHEDESWLGKLRPYLKPLERDGRVSFFVDTGMEAGEEWREKIERGLEEADRAVLLVSQNFLASDFISEVELPAIIASSRERGLRILPVIVSPVAYESSVLASYQSVNDPKRALIDLSEGDQARVFIKVQQLVMPRASEAGGNGPRAPAAPEVSEICDWLLKRKLSIYLGSWTAIDDPETPPTPGELIQALLAKLRGSSSLPIPADVLGSYFSLSQSPVALDQLVETLVHSRAERLPAMHRKLAQILRRTQDAPAPRTQMHAQRQLLVVTTTYDLSLERALIAEGVAFYRIIQMRGTGEILVEHFRRQPQPPAPESLQTGLASLAKPCDIADSAIDTDAVLLFKIHGSVDLEESCSISCEHYYQSVRNSEHLPDLLKGSILRNRDLFLGYSLLDGDLRTLSYSLRRDKKPGEAYRGYFVHARPAEGETDGFRRLESSLWPRLGLSARSLDLELVDRDEETLLSELLAALEGRAGLTGNGG